MGTQMNRAAALLSSTLLASLALPVMAQSARMYTSGCRQGTCWENFVLGQTQISQNRLGGTTNTLYAVEVQTTNTYSGTENLTMWVQCSVSEPFVGFKSPDLDADVIYLHYINPGGNVFGYNSSAHDLYWAVCHNQWDANIWQPEEGLGAMARRLGYSTQLESEQRAVPASLFSQ